MICSWQRNGISSLPTTTAPRIQSCALTLVLLQGLGCHCTVPQLGAGGNGKMGQQPRALACDLACGHSQELLLQSEPLTTEQPRSSQGTALLLPPALGQHWQPPREPRGLPCLQLAPPLLERVSGQYSTSHNSGSCGFHPLQSLQSFYSATRL